MGDFRKVTHKGSLEIGNTRIPCAVLDDGTRVLSETGIANAILKSRSGAARRKKKAENVGALLPVFLVSESLKPFISKDLEVGAHLIDYFDGKREMHGYDAKILPLVCDVWLQAREAGVLKYELKRLNPIVQGKNYRRHTLHQRLSKVYGYTQLRDMIYSDMALMRACDTWEEFEPIFRRSFNVPIDEKI